MSPFKSKFREQLPLTFRHFIQRCLALALSTFLAACGGGGGGESPPPAPAPPTPGTSAAYNVQGRVQGLAEGSTLAVLLNGQPALSLSANGEFRLAQTFRDGDSYQLSVGAPAGAIAQTCSVHAGAGKISGANVADVVIFCSTLTYKLSGQVSGLQSSGLVLQSNGGELVAVAADGRFEFVRPIASGAEYAVTVAQQPGGTPAQTCTVSQGFGMVSMTDITDISVVCSTNTYKIGGAVEGLRGRGLQLQLNGGAVIEPEADKPFAFEQPLASASNYQVTVKAQPTAPVQTCSVVDGSGLGIVGRDNLYNVRVVCSTNSYTVGGMVEGLVGTGLVLLNNGTDDVVVGSNGFFAFPQKVASGGAYAISVRSQPDHPRQTCSANANYGQIIDAEAIGARVVCSTLDYPLTVQVSGLRPGQMGLVLRNNGTDDLLVEHSGSVTFKTRLISDAAYEVTVAQQPTSSFYDTDICTARPGTASGTIDPEVAAPVVVDCAPAVDVVIVRVSGLEGAGLSLKEATKGRSREIAADGEYRLGGYPGASSYAINVDKQPTAQWCFVSYGEGIVGVQPPVVHVRCAARAGTAALLLNPGDDQLELHIKGETDQWQYLTSAPTGGRQPEGIALSPSRKRVYVSHMQSSLIATFEVDVAGGTLRRIGLTSTGIAGARLLMHPSGRFLYLEGSDSKLQVFSIDPVTGMLTSNGPAEVVGHHMVLDQTGRFGEIIAFADWLYSFEIDSLTGKVIPLPNEPHYFLRNYFYAPMIMAPGGNYLLGRSFDDETGQGIALYRRDAASGLLLGNGERPQVFSFGDGDSMQVYDKSVSTLAISSTGRYLAFIRDKASSFTNPTIHFALLDPGTGRVTYSAELGQQVAWEQPSGPPSGFGLWSLVFDPSEKFVYASRWSSKYVDVYAVDPRDGSIRPSGKITARSAESGFLSAGNLVVFDMRPETLAQAKARMRKPLKVLTPPGLTPQR